MRRWTMPNARAERLSLAWDLFRSVAEQGDDGSGGLLHGMYAQNFPSNVDGFRDDFLQYLVDQLNEIGGADPSSVPAGGKGTAASAPTTDFVSPSRIQELRAATGSFDLTRLVRLCEELNACMANECFLAVAALTRALLDHVPPIFGVQTFGQVASNYKGARSFKDSMQHLENSTRKIGDAHLHIHVRSAEVLPTATQVNFSNDLDVLLAEIVRVMKGSPLGG